MTSVKNRVNNSSIISSPTQKLEEEISAATLCPSSPSNLDVVAVMTISTPSFQDQIDSLTKAMESMLSRMNRWDDQIAFMMAKIESMSGDKQTHEDGTQHEDLEKVGEKSTKTAEVLQNVSSDQIRELIKEAIKDQAESVAPPSYTYVKPYTQRIDHLKMPENYIPPKFQQFDGKGNPRQHVAHFVETCNNAGTDGDLLVKQFVRSLNGNAFDWYTDLEPGIIDSWEQLEHDFLNRFYSTRRIVSMVELTNSRQWKDEPVIDYIHRWRNLSLNCKEKFSEPSSIDMCIQGMNWGLRYILQVIKPKSFEELATKAHDMELSMASAANQESFEQELHQGGNISAYDEDVDYSMVVNIKHVSSQVKDKEKVMLKERQTTKYPFHDVDIPNILEELLKAKLIRLPKTKRPKEVDRVDEPNYCKYHRLISHPLEQCFTLKDKIMQLYKEGKIEFEEQEESTNFTSITMASQFNTFENTIKFGSFEPVTLSSKTSKMMNLQKSGGSYLFQEHRNQESWTPYTSQRYQ